MAAKTTAFIEFKTARLIQRKRRDMIRVLNSTADEMTRVVQKKINRPNPYPHKNPSRPGTHPKTRTGFLRDSFKVIRKGLGLRIRVPQYGIWLEGGTGKMRARPFIRRNIHNRRKFWMRKMNEKLRKLSK